MAIFLDLENLFGGYENNVTRVQIGKIVSGIEQIVRAKGVGGHTATARAYANWGRADMGVYQRQMLECGVEPVQVFSFNKGVKNAADIELCVDVLEVAHESPWVDVFVIVTGDGGFIPLIRRLHRLNKYAIVVSTNDPNAGEVNPLLKSVADEYHQIDVSGALAVKTKVVPPAAAAAPVAAAAPAAQVAQVAQVAQLAKTKVVPPAKMPQPKAGDGTPTVDTLRNTIIQLSRTNPQVLVAGKVDTARLGSLLRSKWPKLKYSEYGSKTLGALVEKHCGLVPKRTAQPKAKAPGAKQPAPAKTAPVTTIPVSTREEYVAAVRGLFTGGDLGLLVRDQKSQGAGLSHVGLHLRQSIPDYSVIDSGFVKLHFMLQHALTGTAYHVVRSEDKSMAVVHVDHLAHNEVLPQAAQQDWQDPELLGKVDDWPLRSRAPRAELVHRFAEGACRRWEQPGSPAGAGRSQRLLRLPWPLGWAASVRPPPNHGSPPAPPEPQNPQPLPPPPRLLRPWSWP